MEHYYKNELTTIYNGDCLDVMDYLIEQGTKFDAIITDPPYGTTDCSWDSVIPFDEMWEKLEELIKEQTPILLFGNEPFSSKLRVSNLKLYKYDWKWDKITGANFLNVEYQPLKNIEDIMVFSLGRITNGTRKPINYYPIGVKKENIKKVNKSNYNGTFENSSLKIGKKFTSKGGGYPNCVIEIKKDNTGLHPTQKPLELMKYLIETYTKKGDLILDFTSGSFTTCVAADQLGRRSIGIEMSKDYCDIGIKRLESLQMRLDI